MATTYGSKSLFDVKDEIDRYYDDLYSGLIDGVFLDEFSNDLARVGYYQEIRDYVKGKDANALVIGNPGTSFTNNPSGQTTYTVDDYARSMDVITTFENTGSAYATNYTPPSWVNDFGADRFAHIIHSQSAWTATLLATISARKAGMVYVTDDGSPNPYDQFASYWTTEVKALSDHNDSERSVVSYTATDDLFPNPERGFYRHTETHSPLYTLLDGSTLLGYRQTENVTLILRLFYLEGFVSSAITQAYLDNMQADFNTLRGAGLKAVVRFAYTQDSTAPFGDASKAQIISHLAQLGPVLQANGDVIAVVQAGFTGTWGEWAFTDHFGISDLSDPSLFADRREVLDGILDALPASRMVQLRTPFYKYQMFFPLAGTPSALVPLSPLDAHSGSAIARTGHHNDCFLASETDFGTYGAVGSIGADKGYLEVDTRYVPMGGETCSPNPPRSSCATALLELDRFHWSYLNNGWNPYVLGGWDTGGCMPEVKQRLGYRLALVKGMYSDAVDPGGSFTGHIQLRNDGWAAPFNPRDVELVFRHTVTGAVHSTPLADEDPRFWLAGETQVLDHRFPANVPPGDYDLLLHLPDPEPSIAGRPEYAIRYANDGVWEEGTGYNALGHTVRVLEPAGQAPVADAGPDQNLACTSDAGATVTLDGSGSSGAPSTPLTYSWREGSLEIATGVSPTVNLALGAHTLDLVVDDGTAESAPDQVVIIVEDLIAPTISAALEEVRKESKAKGRKRSKPKPRKKKGSDDDSQSDDSQSDDGSAGRGGNRYRVVLSATDPVR